MSNPYINEGGHYQYDNEAGQQVTDRDVHKGDEYYLFIVPPKEDSIIPGTSYRRISMQISRIIIEGAASYKNSVSFNYKVLDDDGIPQGSDHQAVITNNEVTSIVNWGKNVVGYLISPEEG